MYLEKFSGIAIYSLELRYSLPSQLKSQVFKRDLLSPVKLKTMSEEKAI